MTKTTRTKVSKSNAAIKAIIAATFPTWKGRKVTVIEADMMWMHTMYVGDQTSAYEVHLDDMTVHLIPRPGYLDGPRVLAPHAGCALVLHSYFQGQDMGVEIVVPAGDEYHDSVDPAAVAVAVDALLASDKRGAARALECCRAGAGIAMALAEARAKDLRKGEDAVLA